MAIDIIVKQNLPGKWQGDDVCKLGDMYPFEDKVIRAYFGKYCYDQFKFNLIYCAYFKIRQADFINKIALNFEKHAYLWNLLCNEEVNMHLPFNAINGRNGAPFEVQLPEHYCGAIQ